MKVIGVIAARYGSTRLPGKALKDICGHPMIWWVYQRIKTINGFQEICVATDDDRIKDECKRNNIPCVMTSSQHKTAANRLQEVSDKIPADYYVQINGDEPLINIDAVKAVIPGDIPQEAEYGTNVITKILEPSEVIDPTNIKMVFDDDMNALYMSRTPIPYPYVSIEFEYFKHVGIIGYNKKMLDFYKNSVPGRFERIEGIDTLRFLDYGKTLKLSIVEKCQSLSVDTEKDLMKVRRIIQGGDFNGSF